MVNIALLITLATSIGIYNNIHKPTEYEIKLENGNVKHVIMQKGNKYACPLYCEADHMHYAIELENNLSKMQNLNLYHINSIDKEGVLLYCSSNEIASINKYKPVKRVKDKLPSDIVTASKRDY